MNIHEGRIPTQWRYLKLDLFDNATEEEMMLDKQVLKLAISFQKQDSQDWHYLRAKLNSALRMMRRGVDKEKHDAKHYKLVEDFHNELQAAHGKDLIRLNASKTYRKGYAETKRSVNGISAVVWRDQTNWSVGLVIKHDIYVYKLKTRHISKKARRQGVIATCNVTHAQVGYNMYDADDFL
jgi:hypothetical protein